MEEPILFEHIKNLVFSTFPIIDKAVDNKFIKSYYTKYPQVRYRDNGMPDITAFDYTKINIDDLFNGFGDRKAYVELDTFESYHEVFRILRNDKNFLQVNYLTEKFDSKDTFLDTITKIFIQNIIERYYDLNTTKIENLPLLEQIFQSLKNYYLSENLFFDIACPILCVNFSFEEFKISENICIRKISTENHKSRFQIKSYESPVSDALLSSATHEIVFKNYYSKRHRKYIESFLPLESAYPIEKFELFFNAIKIATNIDSGYAQILAYPHNWADHYSMDLNVVKGMSVKHYPNYFNNFHWNNSKLPTVSQEEIKAISKIYLLILDSDVNKIQIANRRLRNSYLRDNEEDSILDIIIALETLLSDNERTEITHKLALRIAKILSLYNPEFKAISVFETVKKIYDFRSAIVHGSHKVESKRELKLHKESDPIKTVVVANNYLREVIKILLFNPELLNSKKIDELLLQ